MQSSEGFMKRCIQLAKLGKGRVAPNPLVGAVIVHNGKIIGEGYHQIFGEPHAEVNAINRVHDKSVLSESTIYVSLEPCAHTGKTPPCANLLIKYRFKKVVVGSRDSHSKVNGKGIQLLENAGIEVEVGVLEKECLELNKHFFTFHSKQRPYVLLKWAETENGLIDSGSNDGEITWISSKETQSFVHQLRASYQAILVGANTVENDNPSLTVRMVEGKNPIRVVIDPSLRLDNSKKIFNQESRTIIINRFKNQIDKNIEWVQITELTPENILSELYKRTINSVLIEGGKMTLQSFIDSNLWDETNRIIGHSAFETGTFAPVIDQDPITRDSFFEDSILTYINK